MLFTARLFRPRRLRALRRRLPNPAQDNGHTAQASKELNGVD